MSIIDEIAAERRRQLEVEGFGPSHDDGHSPGELAGAGAACALLVRNRCWTLYPDSPEALFGRPGPGYEVAIADYREEEPCEGWPWSDGEWKPKDPRRDLIRAAALIVAELELMDARAGRGYPEVCRILRGRARS